MDERRHDAMLLTDAARATIAGDLTAHALAEANLARIAETDVAVEAWAHLDAARVLARVEHHDALSADRRGLLHGIGIGVKDIIDTTEMPTEMGSPIYAGHHPQFDAECITRLSRAGGYGFGKTVTTAFAYPHPRTTQNPWNARHPRGGTATCLAGT